MDGTPTLITAAGEHFRLVRLLTIAAVALRQVRRGM